MNYNFSKLDDNNLVIGGVVVSDTDCNNGDEATGITFLTNLTGWSKWKLYDPMVDRGMCIGGIYDPADGDFKPEQPGADWNWSTTYKLWRDPADGDNVPQPLEE